jgi:hypothetical protein
MITVQSIVRVIMGVNVLLGAALTYFVNPLWVLYSAFVGVAIIQSGFTGICPGETVARRLGYKDATCGLTAADADAQAQATP